ncbi:MAG: TonB-dependent receptor [Pseudomonadales bacterium]|jgi:iron complex outermembrane receptor protein|nr:TonB-dependent receptor [Pseudomonadales bacterium]
MPPLPSIPPRSRRDALLRALAYCALLPAQGAAADCRDVDVTAGSLDGALLRVGRLGSISVLFQRETVAGLEVGPVAGTADCGELLAALLAGTRLEAHAVEADLFVVRPLRRREAPREVPVPAGARRVEAPEAPAFEELVVRARSVTGSRLRDMGLEGAAQVDIIDRFEIERSGLQSLSEILRFLPAVAGNATSTYVTNGGDGTATVTLRGLPSSHTLVLLNGRRLNTDAFSGAAVDLNSLPLAAIERVEVLKDGASAIHGSDAIAGVVNVITRERLEGLHFSSYGGISSRDDLETQHHSVLFGSRGPRHGLMVGAEIYDRRGIASRDRAISRSSDDRSRGGIDKRSSATAPARVSRPEGALTLVDGASGAAMEDFRTATQEDLFEYRDFTTALVPSRRHSVFVEADWDIDAGVALFGEYLHTRTESTSALAPVPLFTGFEVLDLTVAPDAVFNPFDTPVTDVRRRFTELPPRTQRNRTETERWVLGLRTSGDVWDIELHAAHHTTRAREDFSNVLFGPALQAGLGSASACAADPDCVPVNLFGPPGSIGSEALDALTTRSLSRGDSELLTFALDGATELWTLPAGNMRFSAGAAWRGEALEITPDPLGAAQLLVGGLNFGATKGDRSVTEMHTELLVPLLAGLPGAQQLDLQLADRWSRYSDFGHTHNPKLVLRWRPLSSLLLRASWSEGFRSPTLRELYLSTQQSAAFLVDPCATDDAVGRFPGCSVRSDPTLNQFLTFTGGNAALEAEQARNRTLGLHWTPAAVPGEFGVSVDVYDIEEENVVDASAQFIVDENARSGRFSDRVARDAVGNLQSVTATNLNIGRRALAGADLAIDWRAPASVFGLLELALKATHIESFEDQLDPDAGTVERAGTFQDAASEGNGALPDWKLNLGVTWTWGPWETRYGVHHVTGLREEIPLLGRTRTIGAWTRQNVQVGYRWREGVDGSLAFGVQNIADSAPPFAASAFNDSFDSRTHDLIGRFVYTRLAVEL